MQRVRQKIIAVLQHDYGRGYELVVAALAFFSALFMSVPFAGPMVAAILFQPKRWRRTVLATALGSALGATALLWALHAGLWDGILASKPQLTSGSTWSRIDHWLESYGNWALLAVMSLPIPESPALLFLSRHPQGLLPVFLVTFLGKLVKYWVYAYAAVSLQKKTGPSAAKTPTPEPVKTSAT